VAEIEFVTEEPGTTETFPEFETAKLKRELPLDEEPDDAVLMANREDRSPASWKKVACISVEVRGLL